MEFRRSGNERRRRVLKDELAASQADATESGGSRRSRTQPARSYSDAALAENQPRLTDLIPKRPWTLAILLLCAVLAIAAVESLYVHHGNWSRVLGAENLSAFDPDQRGSIAHWLSSTFLCLAAANGLLTFLIRRHKTDDYRGRYLMWLWVPAVLILASLDAGTGVLHVMRGALGYGIRRFGSETLAAQHPLLWRWLGIVVLSAIVLRVGIEIRRSRGAVAFLAAAVLGGIATLACENNWFRFDEASLRTVACSTLRLVTQMCVTFATFTYLRYVYHDSQGLLRTKSKRPKAVRKKAETEVTGTDEAVGEKDSAEKTSTKRSDLDPVTKPTEARSTPTPLAKPPLTVKPATISKQTANIDDDEGDEDERDGTGMNRAERRRLAKLKAKEIRRAA